MERARASECGRRGGGKGYVSKILRDGEEMKGA